MTPVDIDLVECYLRCSDHNTYDFFEELPYDKYIVRFRFGHTEYGLLEKHHDSVGNIVITMNGRMLYEYPDGCRIKGYRPIKIND